MTAETPPQRAEKELPSQQTSAWPVAPWAVPGDLRGPQVPEADVRLALPGWFFLQLTERTPLGEIWRVSSPWGDFQRAHVVPPHRVPLLRRFLAQIAPLEHPGLLPLRLAPAATRVLLSPWRGRTLVDRILECQHAGLVGIPPLEMLGYLRELATTLDEMRRLTGLAHAGLNPRCVFVHEDRARVAGFGCVELLGRDDGTLALPDPNFAPPECLRGRVHRQSDQAALALLFVAMTTGMLPRGAKCAANGPECSSLSSRDRDVLAKAMHPQPGQRFPDCSSFVHALEEAHAIEPQVTPLLGPSWADSRQHVSAVTSLEDFARELYRRGQRSHFDTAPNPPIRNALRHGMTSILSAKQVPTRLELYRARVGGTWLYQESGQALMELRDPLRIWRRWTVRPSGVRMRLRWSKSGGGTALWARIIPFGVSDAEGVGKLENQGKNLLRELRRLMFALPEQRLQDRIPWRQSICVQPILDREPGEATIAGISVDVSPRGIGLLLPEPLASPQFYVRVPGQRDLEGYAGLAEVVHEKHRRNGWFEIGASFVIDS